MNDLSHLGSSGDVLGDDLLLDRLAGRVDAGGEPVAGLLAALAAHADSPLPARTGRRRIANKHRYLGAFAALAVAASGAGVAAAVTLPDGGALLANRARIEQRMEQSARSGAPSALLSRLGLPATDGTTAARGLVLARGANGTFVLLPAAAARAGTPAVGQVSGALIPADPADPVDSADPVGSGAGADGAVGPAAGFGMGGGPVAGPSAPDGSLAAPAVGRDKAPKDKPAKPARPHPGNGTATGNGQGNGVGNGQAANGQAADGQSPVGQGGAPAGQPAGDPIWVITPPPVTTGTTGSTTTDPSTTPTVTTVAGPAPVGGRLVGSPDQQTLVPPAAPQANRRAVVPGVGPSVTPGAAHRPKPAAPRSPNASQAAAGAPSATSATPATPGAGTPRRATQPVVPTP